MKNNLIINTIIIFLIIPFSILAKSKVVNYEPQIVTLTGIIKFKTYVGPLEDETYPYLFLDHPIDVVPKNDTNPEDVLEKNVKVMQIAADDETSNWSWSHENKFIAKHVNVTGKLFHSITGHHHSRVLIEAIHFAIIK